MEVRDIRTFSPLQDHFCVSFLVLKGILSESTLMMSYELRLILQGEKKETKEKPAIEENAFEALERDFQEVSNYNSVAI